jgi:hypothetical protein
MQRARMDTSWSTVSIGVHALASGVGAVVILARSNGNEAPPPSRPLLQFGRRVVRATGRVRAGVRPM